MAAKEVNISEELKALEQKKGALEKVMKIARAVEQLRYGLESVVLLGKPSSRISSRAMHVFEALSEKIRIQPTRKIQELVVKLNGTIANNLNAVIELASPENEAELHEQVTSDSELADQIDKLIQDYRKSAQTAVALRVVLRERGVPSPPIKWSINVERIHKQITQLNDQEGHYRKKVKSEIILLQQDALVVAGNDKLPQATRDSAAHMHKMLQKDLDHLNAGKDIASMPFFVEVVELQETHASKTSASETKEEKADQPQLQQEQVPTADASGTAQSDQDTSKNKPGFIHKLWRWSTTPPSVTWNDIEQRGKKE
jgi:hypothetical protein